MPDDNIQLEDRNIKGYVEQITPAELKRQMPMKNASVVIDARLGIEAILGGSDKRRLVLVGPCSVHDIDEAKEYAKLLKPTIDKVSEKILVVMRTYFEKPRTNDGWQGLITDPCLNGTNGTSGYPLARELMLYLTELGIPAGTEFLEFETPQYIDDCTSWACIGARTIESQPHRKMASGLSMPVGYKNSTAGNVKHAVDAMVVAFKPQVFPGCDKEGRKCVVYTTGNKYGHVILRGGDGCTNYDGKSIEEAVQLIQKVSAEKKIKLCDKVMIDASHANSCKDYKRQPEVFLNTLKQMVDGNANIIGMMLESYIYEGSQKLDLKTLKSGISVTDGCISLETTKELLLEAYRAL